MKNRIERKAFVMILIFAALLAAALIVLYVSAGATLLPEFDEAEPWEESVDYYIAKYGEREDDTSSVTAFAATPSPQGEGSGGELEYFGLCWITHYCPCSRCCGKSDGITASGTYATEGWTVACGGLPFGTLISINGHTYCVEDRGVGSYCIDIFVSDHQRALELGAYWADVWLVRY